MLPLINELTTKLRSIPSTSDKKVFTGFDGYVDYIQKLVKKKETGNVEYYQSLSDLGGHIGNAAGKSAQIELVTKAIKSGGNAPILSHALGSLGIVNHCVGTMGLPAIHPVFKDLHTNSFLHSIGEPGISNALELDDGKLILSELSTFDSLTLDKIIDIKGADFLYQCFIESDLIALVDWANLPLCTPLWLDLYHFLKTKNFSNKIFFFDLCDPHKKNNQEVLEIVKVIGCYQSLGKTILGLNENEAIQVFQVIKETHSADKNSSKQFANQNLEQVAQYIFDNIHVDLLLVHPVDRTIVVTNNATIELPGRVVTQPKLLTGGGDNLNAGFCFGLLHDFSLQESMLMGMATSGAYVQNGYSPDRDDIINYLNNW
jgi:hypothetical protein